MVPTQEALASIVTQAISAESIKNVFEIFQDYRDDNIDMDIATADFHRIKALSAIAQ
jgi:hypothetical protein